MQLKNTAFIICIIFFSDFLYPCSGRPELTKEQEFNVSDTVAYGEVSNIEEIVNPIHGELIKGKFKPIIIFKGNADKRNYIYGLKWPCNYNPLKTGKYLIFFKGQDMKIIKDFDNSMFISPDSEIVTIDELTYIKSPTKENSAKLNQSRANFVRKKLNKK